MVYKHEIVKERLLELISSKSPGEKLPSVAALKAKFKVSQATIDKALTFLKEEEYVTASPGRGIILKERNYRRNALKRINYILFADAGKYDHTFLAEFKEQLHYALGRAGIWVKTTLISPDATAFEISKQIDDMSGDAFLVTSPYNPEIFDILSKRKKPFIFLFPNFNVKVDNSVEIDNRSIVSHWITHLTELGHKNIAFLHGASSKVYQRPIHERLQLFYEEMGKAGLAVDSRLTLYGGSTLEDGYKAALELMDRGKTFTAVICGDSNAPGIYKACEERGLKVGADVSVIGVDGSSWASKMHPPLTTVRVPRRRIVNTALEKLNKMAAEGVNRCESVEVSTELVLGGSTLRAK